MSFSIRHLTPADYRVMPWKNGQGTTTEIAAMPPGAGLDTFTWRLSIADIGASGPFSSFPGVDRVIVQTAGEVMALAHEGRGRHRLALLQPHGFAGEWSTSGEVSGPVRDFNVMARRGRVRANVAIHELVRGSRVRLLAAGSAHVVYAFRGALSSTITSASGVTSTATAAGAAAAPQQWSLEQGDTWVISRDGDADGDGIADGQDHRHGNESPVVEIAAPAGDAVGFVIHFV